MWDQRHFNTKRSFKKVKNRINLKRVEKQKKGEKDKRTKKIVEYKQEKDPGSRS